MLKNGRPVGNLTLGRRFTENELAEIASGTDVSALVARAPKLKTREEMYQDLFGEESAA
jgi:hypothetical protein